MAMPPVSEGNEYMVLPQEYHALPLRALRMTARRKLANFLDLEGFVIVVNYNDNEVDIENGFGGLAELAGFDYLAIMNFKRKQSPTMAFLDAWTDDNASIGNLWKFLITLERYDVIQDCRRSILNDCKVYQEYQQDALEAERFQIERIQDPTVTNSDMIVDETKYATRDDVITGTRTKYDAFLCYTQEGKDIRFIKEIIRELEGNRGLQLFVPGRNDLPGAAQNSVSAYLIEKRCKRVIIVISRAFLQSAACDFQVRFAQALSPGARSKRLIPIIIEKGVLVPRILRFLAACDFTKTDMIEWIWDRLESAIRAPMGPETFFEPEDEENPFHPGVDINFPTWRPLNEVDNRFPMSGPLNELEPAPINDGYDCSITDLKEQPQSLRSNPTYRNMPVESSWSTSDPNPRSITDNGNTSSTVSSSFRPPPPPNKLLKKKKGFRNPFRRSKPDPEPTSTEAEPVSINGYASMGEDALQCMPGISIGREPDENSYYFSREGQDRAPMSMDGSSSTRTSLSDNEMQREPVESSYYSAIDNESESYVFV